MPPRKPTAPAASPSDVNETPAPSPFRLDPNAVGGDDYNPVEGPVTRNTRAPTIEARPAFLIYVHPARWWTANGRVYPRLGEMRLIAGVNGVDGRRRHDGSVGLNASAARQNIEEAGGRIVDATVIPARWSRDYGWTTYLQNLRSAGRPDVTLARWNRAYPGSDATDIDWHLLDEWVDELYRRQIIAPPMPHILRGMLDRENSKIADMADRATTLPSLRPVVEQMRKTADTIEAQIEEAHRTAQPLAGGDDVFVEGV